MISDVLPERKSDPEMTVFLKVLPFDGHQHDLVPLVAGRGSFDTVHCLMVASIS